MDNPWPEMFSAEVMENLARLLNIKSSNSAKADFIEVGDRIRAIIEATPTSYDRGPTDIPLSRRARWLKRHVLTPSEKLREALRDDPKFAEFPERHDTSISPAERMRIAEHLAKLEAFATDLHDDLEYRSKQKNLRHNIEMRREFLFWIAQVVAKHSRGVDKKRSYTGVEAGAGVGRGNAGPFFAAVKLAYVQITGEKAPQLDDHFKQLVKMQL